MFFLPCKETVFLTPYDGSSPVGTLIRVVSWSSRSFCLQGACRKRRKRTKPTTLKVVSRSREDTLIHISGWRGSGGGTVVGSPSREQKIYKESLEKQEMFHPW